MKALADWPARHPAAAALLILVALGVVGVATAPWLPIERAPSPPGASLVIETRLPGIDPTRIEQLVVAPITDAMSSLPQLRDIVSRARDGGAVIELRFASHDHRESQFIFARQRLAALADVLPAGAPAPSVERGDSPPRTAALYAITAEPLSREILAWAERELRRPLHELPETTTAALEGADSAEVLIQPDARRLVTLGLALTDVTLALQREDTAPARKAPRRIATAVPAVAAAVAARAVRLPSGESIALGEVAQVSIVTHAASERPRHAGQPALWLRVTPRSAAESADVARRVDAHLAWLRANDLVPRGVTLHKVFDEAAESQKWLRRALKRVAGVLALSLAAVLVLLGTRVAVTVLAGLTVWLPVCAGGLWAAGLSLNAMTLIGAIFAGVALVLMVARKALVPPMALLALAAVLAAWWTPTLFGMPTPWLTGLSVGVLCAIPIAWLVSAWHVSVATSSSPIARRLPASLTTPTARLASLALALLVAAGISVRSLPAAIADAAGGTALVRISGDDDAQVMQLAETVLTRLRALPGLSDVVRAPMEEERWQLQIDDERLFESGITIAELGRAFEIARAGLVVGELVDADATLPLRVQLAPGAAGDAFERLLLRGERRDQRALYLRDVGSVLRVRDKRELIRVQRRPAVEIRARWSGARPPAELRQLRESLPVPEGVELTIESWPNTPDAGPPRERSRGQ
jgi:multidrug efflux pump subunit AcrB